MIGENREVRGFGFEGKFLDKGLRKVFVDSDFQLRINDELQLLCMQKVREVDYSLEK